MLGLGFRLCHATPGWGVGVCVYLCARSACIPPLLAWLGGVGVCILGCKFGLRPASPGLVVVVCVWLCASSAFTPPLLAGVCALGVSAWAQVLAAPRHSWLGCWGVCVFVCTLRLYAATPGWVVRCVCVLGLRFLLRLATPGLGVAVCVCLCARSACTRNSWLGRAVWPCVLGLGFQLRPATPCWGVGVCVCLCARSACAPPILAGVCGVWVCAWARVPATPRHSWLGCLGPRVFVCALLMYPATPGWGVRCGCVCFRSGFGCPTPLLAGLLGCVCRCAPSACTPPFLAGFTGVWLWCCLAPVPVPWFVAGYARCPGLRHQVTVVPWLWPAACHSGVPRGPALVRRALSRPFAVCAPVGFPDAVVPFPIPGACATRLIWRLRGARGGRPRTGLLVPTAGRC